LSVSCAFRAPLQLAITSDTLSPLRCKPVNTRLALKSVRSAAGLVSPGGQRPAVRIQADTRARRQRLALDSLRTAIKG
jgi:hypothetical protein